jgi:RimJ/RimL family protein N-acetyltransferase
MTSPHHSLRFAPLASAPTGTITAMLHESYAAYAAVDPVCVETWRHSWIAYDRDIAAYPESVGACGFVSWVGDTPVGFGSWDPRQLPEHGIVGHHCILPRYRNNGFGRCQLQRIIAALTRGRCDVVTVTTGAHDFFLPARRLYERCGFVETGRSFGDPASAFETVHYVLCIPAHESRGAIA